MVTHLPARFLILVTVLRVRVVMLAGHSDRAQNRGAAAVLRFLAMPRKRSPNAGEGRSRYAERGERKPVVQNNSTYLPMNREIAILSGVRAHLRFVKILLAYFSFSWKKELHVVAGDLSGTNDIAGSTRMVAWVDRGA